jgi:hypothetical protein
MELYEKLEMYEHYRRVLHIHGITSDSEDRKIKGHIKKWCDKNNIPVVNQSIFEPKDSPNKDNGGTDEG